MHPQFSAFIDESSALRPGGLQEYLICAAVIPLESADEIRDRLLPLRMKGQVKVHWTDESESRRRKIVSAIAELEPMSAIVTHTSQPQKKTERFRRKCLETIYYKLSSMGVQKVICESRMQKQDKDDVAHLLKLRNQRVLAPEFDIDHCRAGDDPLLWLPDVFLGAVNAKHAGNDEYYKALQEFVIYDAKTPDSL